MNIETLFNALPGAVAQGLIWGIMAIGLYITYKVLDYADLTVDGSMATGGAVCIMLMTNGVNVWIALVCAVIAGMLAGLAKMCIRDRPETCGAPCASLPSPAFDHFYYITKLCQTQWVRGRFMKIFSHIPPKAAQFCSIFAFAVHLRAAMSHFRHLFVIRSVYICPCKDVYKRQG